MIPIILAAVGGGAILGWLLMYLSTNRPHKRKKIPSLTKYVVFSLSMVLIYTITAIIIQCVTGQELSSTLTASFMACFGGEILSSALVKIYKLKEEDKNGYSDPGERGHGPDDMDSSDSYFQGG